jgi:hypothetical protein
MFFMTDTAPDPAPKKAHCPRYRRLLIAAYELKGMVKASEVARLLIESDQTMYNWSTRGVPDKELLRLSRAIGCNPFWLETGEGDMEISIPGISKEAIELARAFDNLSAQQRAAYRVLLNQNNEQGDGATTPIGTETERKRYAK